MYDLIVYFNLKLLINLNCIFMKLFNVKFLIIENALLFKMTG
jgi:hypothetical protein